MRIVLTPVADDGITLTALPDHTYVVPEEVAWIVATVDEYLEGAHRRRRDPGRFHPSDLGLDDEEIIARFNGEEITFTESAQKLRIFDNGHSVHSRWGRYLKKSGLTIKHKKSFYMPRLKLIGTCDEIIEHSETRAVCIVELKSINPFSFNKLVSPKPEHVDQLLCYQAGLRILDGVILYECKGTQSIKLFAMPFDAVRWQEIEQRLMRLRREAERRGTRRERTPRPVIEASEILIQELENAPANDIRKAVAAKGLRLLS
jgi:hypothetical protein